MKVFFFPRDKTFWLYHCIPLVTIWLITLGLSLVWSNGDAFAIAINTACLPLLTLSGLVFRWLYKTRNVHRLSIVKIMPLVVLYATVFGFLLAFLIQVFIVTPFFWQDILAEKLKFNPSASQQSLWLQMVISMGLQMQLVVGLWAFTYISIVNNRRAKESELTNLRLQNSLKEAQLANLNNQLNPHFLFNALNNIRFTIHKNPDKADTMLTGLSEMLRYSLETSRQDKVRLSEELEIVEQYISLMKVQMGERLQVVKTISEHVDYCFIPPMMLQLLVENAVKHGIDKLRHGGCIELNGEAKDQHIVLSVRNTRGENKPLLGEQSSSNTGIGLANIQSRLKLLYGDLCTGQEKPDTFF
jgi:sensor histidine kinase YesM